MTDITDARTIIQVEETRFRAPTSESMFTRVGGSINHIMNRQYDSHTWSFNGAYAGLKTFTGADGVMPILFDMTVVGYLMYVGTGGSSGSTILDLHKLSSGGTDDGTIFTTRPAIDSTGADGSYSFIDVVAPEDIALPTGHTKAVFNQTDFDRGDALRADLDSTMSGSQNLHFIILFRPR